MSTNRNRADRRRNAHKARAAIDAGGRFSFKADNGKTYTLPSAQHAQQDMSAGDILDLAESGGDDTMSQIRMFSMMLRSAAPDAATMDALRAMKFDRFTEVMDAWVDFSSAATPGESSSSSI